MQDLTLESICEGLFRVRDNAAALLDDAKLLRQNDRISRAYALAYMACEESGKFSILYGVATQIALGITIDWKRVRKRFRSHDSKASQFMGFARAAPLILEAAATEAKKIDIDQLLLKATVGVLIGPALFSKRNASVYCDFIDGKFTSPSGEITVAMTDSMIEYAEHNVGAFRSILAASIEETSEKILKQVSKERYDRFIELAAAATEEALSALREYSNSEQGNKSRK